MFYLESSYFMHVLSFTDKKQTMTMIAVDSDSVTMPKRLAGVEFMETVIFLSGSYLRILLDRRN